MPDRQISERQSLGWKKVWILIAVVQAAGRRAFRSRMTGGNVVWMHYCIALSDV
jgi:hypothetical protein